MQMAKLLSMIELRHLRYFLAAAEHGSFRKAGAALGIQESAVSRRIRDLEDRLGASLFQRHNGGVRLTLAGQCFFRQASAAMKHIGDGARDVGTAGRSESGHIRVGIFSSLASGFLADLFQAYDALHSRVRIDFVDGHPTEHLAAVRQHQLDAAFITGTEQHEGCDTTHLWSERVFAVLPVAHRLADRETLVWPDLLRETFIVSEQSPGHEVHDYLLKHLAGLGRHPDVRRQNVGRDNLMSLVAIGRALTLTSEATTAACFPGIIYRPIAGETLPFSVIWSAKNDNPALRRLLSMARARRATTRPPAPPSSMIVPLLLDSAAPSQMPDQSR